MPKIRVLVGVQPPLYCEELERQLEVDPAVEIVGHAERPSDTLLIAAQRDADVVLVPGEEDESTPGLCSHLFAELPDIVVIAICPDGDHAIVFRSTISAIKVDELKSRGLLSAVCRDWTRTGL